MSNTHFVTIHLSSLAIKSLTMRVLLFRQRQRAERRGARPRTDAEPAASQDIEIYSTLASLACTEVLFYPLETVLHRIQLQGTRTIIDNLDAGHSVVPILTSYEGALDCWRTTVATEGWGGLYKGFGALLLQLAAHVAVIRLTKWVVTQISEVYSSRPSSKVAEFYNLEQQQQHPLGHVGEFSPDGRTLSRSLSSQSLE